MKRTSIDPMNNIEFLKLVREIRDNCGLDCFDANYYIFIHKDLKTATVNFTGYMPMYNVAYVIVVCAYRWQNMGYVNSSLTQLLMVDNQFNPVESIPFGNWNFVGLNFGLQYGQWYSCWRPIPKMELARDPSIRNYGPAPDGSIVEKLGEWNWGQCNVQNFTEILTKIHEFVEANPM